MPEAAVVRRTAEAYAEEIDTTAREHLGDFPQAFTLLALIEAVSMLIGSEQEGNPASSG